MKKINIRDEFIKLEQALKLTGEFEIGSDAKYAIKDGEVKVNGNVEYQRGKKLRDGDIFTFNNYDYKIFGNKQL